MVEDESKKTQNASVGMNKSRCSKKFMLSLAFFPLVFRRCFRSSSHHPIVVVVNFWCRVWSRLGGKGKEKSFSFLHFVRRIFAERGRRKHDWHGHFCVTCFPPRDWFGFGMRTNNQIFSRVMRIESCHDTSPDKRPLIFERFSLSWANSFFLGQSEFFVHVKYRSLVPCHTKNLCREWIRSCVSKLVQQQKTTFRMRQSHKMSKRLNKTSKTHTFPTFLYDRWIRWGCRQKVEKLKWRRCSAMFSICYVGHLDGPRRKRKWHLAVTVTVGLLGVHFVTKWQGLARLTVFEPYGRPIKWRQCSFFLPVVTTGKYD